MGRDSTPVVPERSRRVLRNGLRARGLHAAVFLAAGFLLLSGMAIMGEGVPELQTLLGGHVATGRYHRWAGLGLVITLVLLVPVLRPRAVLTFVRESTSFSMPDLQWLRSLPGVALGLSRQSLPWHRGHFDPGQRLFNLALVAAFLALSVTGILMAFPDRFQPLVFAWSLRIHRIATWLFVALAAAHIFVASGLLPGYRGVWRAMLGSGRVDQSLAQRLWPGWAERADAADKVPSAYEEALAGTPAPARTLPSTQTVVHRGQ
ncbi:MAG TPA: cytochrome b/b6 domain-containing protein [Dehalococcoidia bacterium]|nr:cytochrome b/b6 domain-containing protein [Dehalococcoidia bacterium]